MIVAMLAPASRRLVGWVSITLLPMLGCGGPPSASSEAEAGESDEVGESESSSTTSGDEIPSGGPNELDIPEADPPELDPMVVMTFNVLCSFCDDTYDPWDERVPYIADTIGRHAPDLVGLQELFTADEVQQLLALLPEYDVLFYSDDTSDYADATIGWRADRYSLVDSGFYWLSPAPDLPFSVGFASPQFPRLVAWAQLHELATGAELLFVDTHFDNNTPSQELSAPLLLERTANQAGTLPIIVVGDFNSQPDSAAYAILTGGVDGQGFALTNSFDLAPTWTVESNQDPVPPYDPATRIDHVFVAGGNWSAPTWTVDTWVYGASDKHTSDHFAIAVALEPG